MTSGMLLFLITFLWKSMQKCSRIFKQRVSQKIFQQATLEAGGKFQNP